MEEKYLRKEALRFVVELAEQYICLNTCNDLEDEDIEKFKDIIVDNDDEPGDEVRSATHDFDIIDFVKREYGL